MPAYPKIATSLPVVGVVLLLTALGYLLFPGHTYLQQDSQIYVPILERLWDPTVLANDPIAVRHHVTFTIYDEIAMGLRWLTGLGLEPLLVFDQLFHRALGVLGVYLMATALGLSFRQSMLVAAVYALGATVSGPAVLTVEYEPKPRASAVPMLLLAVGCIARRWYLAGGVAGAVAFAYHPPTVYPFWAVYFMMEIWPARPDEMKRRIYGITPLAVAVVTLFVAARLQPGGPEPQPFFGRIDPELEQLQRMRGSYAWVSEWIGAWAGHYLFVFAVAMAAFLRLRKAMPSCLQFFAVGLPVAGMLSLPLTWLLLDRYKWILMPKLQPARAVLFITVMAVILAMAASMRAAQSRRIPEALMWGVFAFAVPIRDRVSTLLLPDLGDPLTRRRVAIVLALSGLAASAAWLEARRSKAGWAVWGIALAAPFFLIPYYGKVVNYPTLDERQLCDLSGWAQASTPKDAVFLFPDAGKRLDPGFFRARALRAVYVDWKGGGQVNMVKAFGQEWWQRWRDVMDRPFDAAQLDRYAALGIDYIVVRPDNRLAARSAIFENAGFIVYRVK